jgi:hypothetical protein
MLFCLHEVSGKENTTLATPDAKLVSPKSIIEDENNDKDPTVTSAYNDDTRSATATSM